MSRLQITYETTDGVQEMPPEALAQGFEAFLLRNFYTDPQTLDAQVKARNMRNHFYRFITEDIHVRSEVPHPNEFVYMNKDELVKLHHDLTQFETLIVKRCSQQQKGDPDTLAAITELQAKIEAITPEYD